MNVGLVYGKNTANINSFVNHLDSPHLSNSCLSESTRIKTPLFLPAFFKFLSKVPYILFFTMTLSTELRQSVHPSQRSTIVSLHGTSPCSVDCHGEDTAHTRIQSHQKIIHFIVPLLPILIPSLLF